MSDRIQNPGVPRYQAADSMEEAIAREKQIKGGSHQKKIKRIEIENLDGRDLYEDLSEDSDFVIPSEAKQSPCFPSTAR
jgi:hypothetical protein